MTGRGKNIVEALANISKIVSIVIVGIFVLVIGAVLLFAYAMVEKHELAEIDFSNRGFTIEIQRVDGGALTASYVQVIKNKGWFDDEIIKNIKSRRTLQSVKIVNADTLQLVVLRGNDFTAKGDTVLVDIGEHSEPAE